MKFIRVNDKQVDVVVESEEYIDIFTYRDFTDYFKKEEDDDDWLYLDNGKGWRIEELVRMDKKTGVNYLLQTDPCLCNFDGHSGYCIFFIKDDSEYHRCISKSFNDKQDFIGYVTQDACSVKTNSKVAKELLEKYNTKYSAAYYYDKYSEREDTSIKSICVDFLEREDMFCACVDKRFRFDCYIRRSRKDFEGTNELLRDFFDFSRRYYMFGRKGEEPRLLEVVGENKQAFNVKTCSETKDGIADVRCLKPNKYKKVNNVQKWAI